MLPSLFIAHGSPMLIAENNEYTQFLNQLGSTFKGPKAIIIFSAHWVSDIQMVSSISEYDTIHDFGGFPEELYRIQYPAKGDKEIAEAVQTLLEKQGVSFEIDNQRGLDHGAWVVLKLMYPDAEIPVISMSVNPDISPEEQYKIGKSLMDLRKKDILIIASGGTVHNLMALNWEKDNGVADAWALNFDNWLENKLKSWNLETLYNYHSVEPSAKMAVPVRGVEHFIPIFYAMGAADDKRKAELLHRSYRYGNLSHSVWQFG